MVVLPILVLLLKLNPQFQISKGVSGTPGNFPEYTPCSRKPAQKITYTYKQLVQVTSYSRKFDSMILMGRLF